MKTFWLVSVVMCCSLVSAQITDMPATTGNAFVRVCSATEKRQDQLTAEDPENMMACVAYVVGFKQGVDAGVSFAALPAQKVSKPFCIPGSVETGQLVRTVLKYVRNHPEKAHEPTPVLMFHSLAAAYPCTAGE